MFIWSVVFLWSAIKTLLINWFVGSALGPFPDRDVAALPRTLPGSERQCRRESGHIRAHSPCLGDLISRIPPCHHVDVKRLLSLLMVHCIQGFGWCRLSCQNREFKSSRLVSRDPGTSNTVEFAPLINNWLQPSLARWLSGWSIILCTKRSKGSCLVCGFNRGATKDVNLLLSLTFLYV